MADEPDPPEKPISAASYDEVVGAADLIDVKLLRDSYFVEPDFFSSKKRDLKLNYGCEFGHGRFDSEDRTLVGTFHLEAGAKKGRKWVLRVRAIYIVAFNVEGVVDERAALAYVQRVGRFACFPYFRAHYSELCAQSGANLGTLPVIKGNLPRKIKAGEQGLSADSIGQKPDN